MSNLELDKTKLKSEVIFKKTRVVCLQKDSEIFLEILFR